MPLRSVDDSIQSWSTQPSSSKQADEETFLSSLSLQTSDLTSTPVEDSGTFAYNELDYRAREIRLLVIGPAMSEAEDDVVRGILLHVSLDNRPAYETISYAWGDKARCRPIFVDDGIITVPENTWRAIRKVQLPDRERTVWIDAVCINQEDFDERARQVELMGAIYSASLGGLIYLGEGIPSLEQAIPHLLDLSDEYQAKIKRNPDTALHSPPQQRLQSVVLLEFFSIQWFQRCWVTQEASLAPENLLFIADHTFDLQPILEVVRWLYIHWESSISGDLGRSSGFRNALDISYNRRWLGMDTPIPFAVAMDARRYLETSNDRDRVYGILGVTHRSKEIPALLAPDYNKPVALVMRDAVRYTLSSEQSLECLRLVSHFADTDLDYAETPSWVAHYERPVINALDPYRLPQLQGLRTYESPTAGKPEHVLVLEPGLDANILRLHAHLVGDITQVSDVLFDIEIDPEDIAGILQSVTMRVVMFASCLANSGGERLSRTLVACSETGGKPFHGATWDYLLHEGGFEYQNSGDSKDTFRGDEKRLGVYRRAIRHYCRNRRLADISLGYVCLAPRITRPGDKVAITMDPEALVYVLRPLDDGTYHYIGECYVDELRTMTAVHDFTLGRSTEIVEIR